MRRVLHGDLVHLARVLLNRMPESRPAICRRAIAEAHAADKYRHRFGRRHPEFGDGSLAAWAMRFPRPPEPPLDDPDYAACLCVVLTCLKDFRSGFSRERTH
jgi:hypothetical protein